MRTRRSSSLPDTQRSTTERLQCGRHGGHPSQRIMRTTRRSSLPTDHADDTEVIPPALQTGRVRLRADRSACVPRIMWTTRRSSLPDTQNAPSEPAHCGLSSSYDNKTKARKPNLQTFAPLNFATFRRPKGICYLHTPAGLLPPSDARRAFATFTRPKGFCYFHTPEGLSPSATCFRTRSRGRLARLHGDAGVRHSSE
jgi:hypothetical protein